MKIEITATTKEIADLVLALQGQQKVENIYPFYDPDSIEKYCEGVQCI